MRGKLISQTHLQNSIKHEHSGKILYIFNHYDFSGYILECKEIHRSFLRRSLQAGFWKSGTQ